MPHFPAPVQKHIARKRFGQNFLHDAGIIDGIISAINPQVGENIIEIGPGLMALTQPLLNKIKNLTVIEIDRDLIARLEKVAGLNVIASDVLRVDFAALAAGERLRIVGNLPYNISSPILFHLLSAANHVIDQHFMLQKEVVDRMVAAPATADYGRLSVMLQWRYAMECVLAVPPESFTPAPRVDSAVVRMCTRDNPVDLNVGILEELVKVAFSQRRKILRHTLGKWLEEKGFDGTFDYQRRAEEVPVDEYLQLAKLLSKNV